MCQVLEVRESGYYRYLKNLGKLGRDAVLSAAIQKIIDESEFNDNYGVPRMQPALALIRQGQPIYKRCFQSHTYR